MGVVEYARRLNARVVLGDYKAVWDHPRKARVFKSAPAGTADAEIKHPPSCGRPGLRVQRFPLSKPVVGRNIAMHAVPD